MGLIARAAGIACLLSGLPAAAQTLEIATDQSPVGLDPHVATAFSTLLINGVIHEGLTAIDAGLGTVPALAESWTVSPDGLVYTFRLRAHAAFHDGRDVTAADVAASLARVRDPRTGSPYASRFAGIASVAPEGAKSVRIVLKEPSAPFLTQLAALAIVPAGAADLARKPIGAGPFKFKEWVPDTYIALQKHDRYYEPGLPKLDGLRFNIVPEAATRQVGLSGGTYHMLPSIDAATALSLAGQPGVTVLETEDLAYSLVGLNVAKPPFDKPEVREAVNLAIDRNALVAAAYFGKGRPGGPLSPALKDWALDVSAFPCYRPDPARAKALLQEAGLALPVKVTLNVLGSLQLALDAAQVIQADLNKAGFEAALNVQEQGKFIQDWRNSSFEAFVSLNSGSPEPDDYLGRTFQTGGATNVFKYSNPDLDRILVKARAAADKGERKRLYDEAQKILACRGPVVHLAYGTLFTAVRSAVEGYAIAANRSTRALRETSLKP